MSRHRCPRASPGCRPSTTTSPAPTPPGRPAPLIFPRHDTRALLSFTYPSARPYAASALPPHHRPCKSPFPSRLSSRGRSRAGETRAALHYRMLISTAFVTCSTMRASLSHRSFVDQSSCSVPVPAASASSSAIHRCANSSLRCRQSADWSASVAARCRWSARRMSVSRTRRADGRSERRR